MSRRDKYSGRVLKPLSRISFIDEGIIPEIQDVIPPITPEQIEEITLDVIENIDLDSKVDKVLGESLVADTEIAKIHSSGSDNQDLSDLVIKEVGKSLVADTEIAKIHTAHSDDQDLSGKVDKETGKGLSTNDYTTVEQTKLSGIESGANNYSHPANHPPSIITQDISNRFVTDTEKSTWNGKEAGGAVASHESSYVHANIVTAYNHSQAAHAPSNAQVNADGGVITGILEVRDHGTETTDEVINVCYGTSPTPPVANTTTIGTLYVQYVP